MSLFLVAADIDLTIEIPISPDSMDAIALHLLEMRDGWAQENFRKRLAEEVGRVLPEIIDWRFKAPTKAQVALAKIICRKLDVSLPTDAVRYRGEMCRFLEVYQPRLRANRAHQLDKCS